MHSLNFNYIYKFKYSKLCSLEIFSDTIFKIFFFRKLAAVVSQKISNQKTSSIFYSTQKIVEKIRPRLAFWTEFRYCETIKSGRYMTTISYNSIINLVYEKKIDNSFGLQITSIVRLSILHINISKRIRKCITKNHVVEQSIWKSASKFILSWENFWRCNSSSGNIVKSPFNIWSYCSIGALNIQTRFHHVMIATVTEPTVAPIKDQIYNNIRYNIVPR